MLDLCNALSIACIKAFFGKHDSIEDTLLKVFLRTSSPDTKVVVVVKLVEVAINVVVVERNADARA